MSKKFLSLDWFKETAENAIGKVIASKLESLMEEEEEAPLVEKVQKGSDFDVDKKVSLYLRLQLVNDVLTVVFNDGNILSKPNATEEDYYAVVEAKSELEISVIMSSHEVMANLEILKAETERIEILHSGIKLLSELPDFTVEGTTVYLKGTSRSLPQLLIERFLVVIARAAEEPSDVPFQEYLNLDNEYLSLKNFFMWCCLNPRAEVAHELYRFLEDNSFRITSQGFVVALRNVVTVEGADTELVQFISNAYNKVKAVWKKKPSNYRISIDDDTSEYVLELVHSETISGEIIGNLETLYLELPNMKENRFTDHWTKTFDIRIGQVTSMPLEECNWSTQDCATAGLHFTADQIHYVGCGDQSVIVLINPMKIVGIGQHKGRCYEYLPIMTVSRDEATRILHDGEFDALQLDEEYAIRELESLVEKAKEGFAIESKKYEFNLPAISASEINTIVGNLNEMKNKIVNRVTTIN